jgi:hypothetical protein
MTVGSPTRGCPQLVDNPWGRRCGRTLLVIEIPSDGSDRHPQACATAVDNPAGDRGYRGGYRSVTPLVRPTVPRPGRFIHRLTADHPHVVNRAAPDPRWGNAIVSTVCTPPTTTTSYLYRKQPTTIEAVDATRRPASPGIRMAPITLGRTESTRSQEASNEVSG